MKNKLAFLVFLLFVSTIALYITLLWIFLPDPFKDFEGFSKAFLKIGLGLLILILVPFIYMLYLLRNER
jgi:hypothetical protein